MAPQAAVHFGFARVRVAGDSRLAVESNGVVTLLDDLVPGAPVTFEGLLEDWDAQVVAVSDALAAGASTGTPAADVQFEIPGVDRPAVYCAGANYVSHIREMGFEDPGRVYHFVSPPGVLNAHGRTVGHPVAGVKLDWEAELAVVIGRPARAVPRDEALDYVAGYAIANDVSVRGREIVHPIFGIDWTFAKNAEGLTPLGPTIVPAAFVPDPGDLAIGLDVNGVVRQDSRTSELIAGVGEQIEALSALITLRPGDVILTGTPGGTGNAHGQFLAPGDVMVARIEGLGELVNVVA